MQTVRCPRCDSDNVSALVRVYYAYDVRGITRPSRQAPSSQTLVLAGRPEEIESGIDADLKCRNSTCGHEFPVPETARVFRRSKNAPLEDCNI